MKTKPHPSPAMPRCASPCRTNACSSVGATYSSNTLKETISIDTTEAVIVTFYSPFPFYSSTARGRGPYPYPPPGVRNQTHNKYNKEALVVFVDIGQVAPQRTIEY